MTVRRATRADAPAIIAMGRELIAESPNYRGEPLSEEKVMALGERLQGTLLAQDGCVLVTERDGELVGMMVICIVERFFGDGKFVTDLTLYVKPPYRGSLAFPRLVQAAERWARDQGVFKVVFGVSTEIHPQETVHAYQRMGYTLNGYTLTKWLHHGD